MKRDITHLFIYSFNFKTNHYTLVYRFTTHFWVSQKAVYWRGAYISLFDLILESKSKREMLYNDVRIER